MTYTPNTPQASQTIAFTQPLIEANFTYIEDSVERDHAWQGNIIGTEEPGRHQKISMPNQGADIVALPAGCSTVEYSIGGNKYMWNGAKRPVSGIAGTAITVISPVFSTLFTVPNDCIGFVAIQGRIPPLTNQSLTFSFNVVGGVPFWQQPYPVTGSQVTLTVAISGGNFQVATTDGSTYNASHKYIYWPI